MNPLAAPSTSPLDARVTVPRHVVYRRFPAETVVLNLDTGTYHGLNPIAGRMLEALDGAPSVRDAAAALLAEYEVSPAQLHGDLIELCDALIARGLIALDAPPVE